MNTFVMLVKRNTKLFFKDKSTLFTSMIAPLILLVLFVTFLGNIYRESFQAAVENVGIEVADSLINGFVGGWLFSSLLAVCCVTVAFTANMISVEDKVKGRINDISISPVRNSVIAAAYYASTLIVSLFICFVALAVGFVYIAIVGWYLSVADVFLVILDVVLLVMIGTALSSIIAFFIKSQGGMTAVVTIVSAVYGFLCGAYMPISSFTGAIRNFIMFLPGTYGTSLLHTHLMQGTLSEMSAIGFPSDVVREIGDNFDTSLFFFGNRVEMWQAYLVIAAAVVALVGTYILLSARRIRKKNVAIR